jgi:hypothetical protein
MVQFDDRFSLLPDRAPKGVDVNVGNHKLLAATVYGPFYDFKNHVNTGIPVIYRTIKFYFTGIPDFALTYRFAPAVFFRQIKPYVLVFLQGTIF